MFGRPKRIEFVRPSHGSHSRTPRILPISSHFWKALLPVALLGALWGPGPVAAQSAGQAWEWPLLRGGRLEFRAATEFTAWARVYGKRMVGSTLVEEVDPLGYDLTDASEVSRLFPGERELREALGEDGFRLNLGVGQTSADAGVIRLPLRAALGVTNWLTVGVNVAFERRLLSLTQGASADSAGAGVSPTISDPVAVETFLLQFESAVQSGQSAADALCASVGESDPGCIAARQSVSDAGVLFHALAVSYTGSPVFALDGSAAGTTLTTRLEELRAALAGLGVSDFTAPLPLSDSELADLYRERMIQEPASGIATINGEGWYNVYELGDVEVTADLRLLDYQAVSRETGDPRWHFRLAVGGVYRLGVGVSGGPVSTVDFGSFSGQADMEGRAFADVGIGDWLGVSSDFRYGVRGPADGTLGWDPTLLLVNTPLASAPVRWEPGNYTSFRIVPRLRLTQGLNLIAEYWSMTADPGSYTLVEETAPIRAGSSARFALPDLSFLESKSGGEMTRAGVGATYSTLYRVAERGSGLPLMVRGRVDLALDGSGGVIPKSYRFTADLRFFVRIWGD